ncbi:dethiobiotin synthase [Geothermobacter ehrlichii]|uniref:ATP-dependent dethiobiotin synthetase BioD n=1 Tax=Geothermobacter ehrlichii TaxID=213224 RepID=A0A5D3WRW9_9BACT|nr:dethiobiotin synthase [Geothermobacter ehrlichii]TYP00339.1 dethiobiotin synthase [Geothermobacter ehrlichii]
MAAADRPRGLFVTGTDTGVGKTLVGAALARLLAQRGLKVGVCKPVESGVADPSLPGPDARLLGQAAGCDAPAEIVAPYRLRKPLAPDQAARAEGVRLDLAVIERAAAQLAGSCDFLIVEGAGGLMAPLTGGFLMADLARQLGLPLLIVARHDLGTINHTLLTTFAARQMELPVAGIILNRLPEHPDEAQRNAPHAIASLASADLLASLPEVFGEPMQQVEELANHLQHSPTLPWLLAAIGAQS